MELPSPVPAAGVFDGLTHLFAVRIYYEDTDLSGLVYHANYLRYLERARTDWVGQLGMDQQAAIMCDAPHFFVVSRLSIDYRRPARLGDGLGVRSRLVALGGASLSLHQTIWRSDTQLVDATVRVALVGAGGVPRRLPKPLHDAMSALLVA